MMIPAAKSESPKNKESTPLSSSKGDKLDKQDKSDAATSVLTDGTSQFRDQCRYCFAPVIEDYSVCLCKSKLCRVCMERELCLTEGRAEHELKCTVCQFVYEIDYVCDTPNMSKYKILWFLLIKQTLCLYDPHLQGSRVSTVRERLALGILIGFLAFWTSATTYSIILPGITNFNTFSIELIIYLFLVAMDMCVGLTMVWFAKLINTLQLTIPFALIVIHICRMGVVVFLRFFLLNAKQFWTTFGAGVTILTSMIIISTNGKLWYKTAKIAWYRTKLREISILVCGKGPFKLSDMDARVDAMSDDTVTQIVQINMRGNQNANFNQNENNSDNLQQLSNPVQPIDTSSTFGFGFINAIQRIETFYHSLLSRTNSHQNSGINHSDINTNTNNNDNNNNINNSNTNNNDNTINNNHSSNSSSSSSSSSTTTTNNSDDVMIRPIDRRGSNSGISNAIVPTSEIQISQIQDDDNTNTISNDINIKRIQVPNSSDNDRNQENIRSIEQ